MSLSMHSPFVRCSLKRSCPRPHSASSPHVGDIGAVIYRHSASGAPAGGGFGTHLGLIRFTWVPTGPPPLSPLSGYQCQINTSASRPAGSAALSLSARVAVTHRNGFFRLHFMAAGEVAAFPPSRLPSAHYCFSLLQMKLCVSGSH